jgi:hypothetical protein
MNHLILFVLLGINIYGQVNIEQLRDTTGKIKKNQSPVINISNSFRKSKTSQYEFGVQYIHPFKWFDHHGFFIEKLNYGKSNNYEYINKNFTHFRLIFSGAKNYFPELYLQSEYNSFSTTKQRNLAGIGLRYSIFGIVYGSGVIKEWVSETNHSFIIDTWRLSQYISYVINFNAFNRLSTIFYLQPSIHEFSNIRLLIEASYTSQITQIIGYTSSITAKQFSKSRWYTGIELFFESGLSVKL